MFSPILQEVCLLPELLTIRIFEDCQRPGTSKKCFGEKCGPPKFWGAGQREVPQPLFPLLQVLVRYLQFEANDAADFSSLRPALCLARAQEDQNRRLRETQTNRETFNQLCALFILKPYRSSVVLLVQTLLAHLSLACSPKRRTAHQRATPKRGK